MFSSGRAVAPAARCLLHPAQDQVRSRVTSHGVRSAALHGARLNFPTLRHWGPSYRLITDPKLSWSQNKGNKAYYITNVSFTEHNALQVMNMKY